MARRYWTCRKCHYRQERRTNSRKCLNCGEITRPQPRVAPHARTLRDDSYEVYRALNEEIHGAAFGGEWQPDDCGCCGKHASSERHNDRDHDHETGLPRGLACPGNTGCNSLMPRQLTLPRAKLIVAYLERVERFRALSGAYVASEGA